MKKRQRGSNSRHMYTRLDLTCWSINYDGEVSGRVWSTHCLSPFHGTKDITSLDLVPEAFLSKGAPRREGLINRGKHFWSLKGQQYREYVGETFSEHTTEELIRVVIDHLTYQRRNDWPIVIDRKQGPSTVSNNWKDTRFRSRPCDSEDDVDCGRGSRARRSGMIWPEDYSPERDDSREPRYLESYKKHNVDRPPIRVDSKYSRYDLIEPNQEPDELALLLSPQIVHGFCLRDKTWSKFSPLFATCVRQQCSIPSSPCYPVEPRCCSRAMTTAQVDDMIARLELNMAQVRGSKVDSSRLAAVSRRQTTFRPSERLW